VFDDRSPIYQQIADRIKEDILSGTLREGEQVMSTNQYAAFYRINPATAAEGCHQLVQTRPIVSRTAGSGLG
jgi:GntR family transcriptional regulator